MSLKQYSATDMTTEFSAAPQALGYYYQIRYGLFLLVSQKEDVQLSIEKNDDLETKSPSDLNTLFQIKHHMGRKPLTDTHKDLWKTILIWSTYIAEQRISIENTILTLVTNSPTTQNSIPWFLRPANRKCDAALERMRKVASTSNDKSLRNAFRKFESLTADDQRKLVEAIYVLDLAPNISSIEEDIKSTFIAIDEQYHDTLLQSVEGWWLKRVIDHLVNESTTCITSHEVRRAIVDKAEQLPPRSLPHYHENDEPEEDTSEEVPLYVRQLLRIAMVPRAVRMAKRDYIRAYRERSSWVHNNLLFDEDDFNYNRRLKEAWEHCLAELESDFQLKHKVSISEADEDTCKAFGQTLYSEVCKKSVRMKTFVTEDYVTRGSYHMLANEMPPIIGWHPNFELILEELVALV
jgi:hypothetical protein